MPPILCRSVSKGKWWAQQKESRPLGVGRGLLGSELSQVAAACKQPWQRQQANNHVRVC